MAAVSSLNIDLKASTAQFTKGFQRATNSIGKFQRSAVRLRTVVASLGAAALVGGITVLSAGMRVAAKNIDNLAKASSKLGVATEELSRLQFAAQQTGVNTQTLNMAIQRLTRRVSEAASGTGEAKDAIKELGLSAQTIESLDPAAQFRLIAGAMGKVENQADRVRLAFKLFDSEGVALVNTLALGTKGLEEMARQSDALNNTISQVDADKIERMNDAFSRTGTAVGGAFNRALAFSTPLLEDLADAMTFYVAGADGLSRSTDKAAKSQEDLAAATAKVAKEMEAQKAVAKKAEDAMKAQADSVEREIDAIVKQSIDALETFGLTERQKTLRQLSELGLSKSERAFLDRKFLAPLEKLQDRSKTKDIVTRDLDANAMTAFSGSSFSQSPSAVERGSAAAASAIAQAGQRNVISELTLLASQGRDQVRELRDINRNTRAGDGLAAAPI